MAGSPQRRFCGDCQKNVHDVAKMTRREVLKVYNESDGHCCMRITRRKDGSVVFNERSLSEQVVAGAHAPLFAFLSGLSLLVAARPALAQSAPSTDVPAGYTMMTLDAPSAAGFAPETIVDVISVQRSNGQTQVTMVAERAKLLSHPNGPTTISVLVTKQESEKIALAQKTADTSFALSTVLDEVAEMGDVVISTGVVAHSGGGTVAKEDGKGCFSRMDDRLKRVVKFCLEAGKWVRED